MAIPAYYSLIQRGSSARTWPRADLAQRHPGQLHLVRRPHRGRKVRRKREKAVREFQLRYASKRTAKWARTPGTCSTPATRPGTASPFPYPGIVLRSGSAGGCVRLVQQKLNAEGERLTTDGKFGTSTVAAVKRYQTRHNLTSDGSVGKDTWEKMFPAALT